MLRFLTLLLGLLLFAGSVQAQTIAIGTIRYDQQGYAYYYNGTNWLYGTDPYICTGYVAGTSYVSCGHCYSTAGYYTFSKYVAPAVATVVIPPYTPDWKTQVTKAIDQQNDRIAYLKAVEPLYPPKIFGAVGGVGGYTNSLLAGTFGINVSTQWGYQQPSLANVLAQLSDPFNVDANQQLLQYGQIVKAGEDAQTGLKNSFGVTLNDAQNKAFQLSAIKARAAALTQVGTVLDGPPGSSTATVTITPGKQPTASGTAAPPFATAKTLNERWNASAQSCVQCHHGTNGERKDGGFSLASFPGMDEAGMLRVLRRLKKPESDPEHMPKGGKSLTPEELAPWIEVASTPALPMPKIK